MALKKIPKKLKVEQQIEEVEEAVEAEEIVEEVVNVAAQQLEDNIDTELNRSVEQPPIWSVQHIPVQTEPAIHNSDTGENLTLHEAVVRILNIAEGE